MGSISAHVRPDRGSRPACTELVPSTQLVVRKEIDKRSSIPYNGLVPPTEPQRDEKTSAVGQRVAELEAELARARLELAAANCELSNLRKAYRRALEQLQLLQRRLFMAKSERPVTPAEQLEFKDLCEEVARLEKLLDAAAPEQEPEAPAPPPGTPGNGKKKRPNHKGRRDLDLSKLPVVRIEILDPALEGTAERIGFDERSRLGYERGGHRQIVLALARYKVVEVPPPAPVCGAELSAPAPVQAPLGEAAPEPSVAPTVVDSSEDQAPEVLCQSIDAGGEAPATSAVAFGVCPSPPRSRAKSAPEKASYVMATPPRELVRRGLLAPSLIAHLFVSKYVMGTPFFRIESNMAFEGAKLDRGTMCRYGEEVGAALGGIVLSMRDDAMHHAFCLSTDATGVRVQPEPLADGRRQPCKKGHFFVVLADRDHIFFEYQAKHTSAVVCEMFRGFSGYIQADAHAIYDALFRGDALPPDDGDTGPPKEVGCWAHARRRFWEATVCKYPLGIEGLRQIGAIFAADEKLGSVAPAQRKALRLKYIKPMVDDFFAWVARQILEPRERGLVSSALGYSSRQQAALERFLEDGRLRLDNNGAERAFKPIATGRRAWLFFGSDDHASAAANLLSLIASCKLHGLDPEAYLAEVIHVMPYWPRERYLELCPRDWLRTRARLDEAELARELGPITVPAALPSEEQPLPR
jgi:transposase